jgi:predicted permease
MSLWRQMTRGLRVLTNRSAADQELDDEVRHFFEEAVAANMERGLSPKDARRLARTQLGDARVVREQVRDYGWENLLGTVLSDLRFAGRMLRKNPVFTAVVVLVVALGSGAVTTIFSAMNSLLLRPIPGVADGDRLATLQPIRSDGLLLQQGSFREYAYLRERSRTLAEIGAWGKVSLTIANQAEGTPVWGNMVSGNYFEVLGVRPSLGRFFAPDEDRTPLASPVIVVSHAFWKARLGGDRTVIGRSLLVNGNRFTLIGVAPKDFRGIYTGIRADAWVPLMMQPLLRPRANLTTGSWLWIFGRLNDGMTFVSTQRELAALMASRAQEQGEPKGSAGFRSMAVFAFTGLPGGEGVVMFRFIAVLLGAALLVLLIAGVNVAAMLTARAATRGRELAVRAALGAGRSRLVRQLLTEIVLLFTIGAFGGFVIAVMATTALEQLPLPANIPLQLELSPDLRVLAFAVGTSLVTGLIFGLAPAFGAVRRDIIGRLREEAPVRGSRRSLINRTIIVGQLALSLMLLVFAGLFLRALLRGQHIDPGFKMARVLTTTFETESWGYNEGRSRTFFATLRARVASLPNVAAVSYVGRLPLTGGSSTEDIELDGKSVGIDRGSVDTDYFSTLRIPITQGRAFRAADDERAPRVAIVNDSLAHRISPDRNVVGRSFTFLGKPTTIVGVVRDTKYATLGESTPLFAYFPLAQAWQPTQSLIVLSDEDSDWLPSAIQHMVLAIDPALARPNLLTLKEATSIVLLPQRVAAMVTGVLGSVGLLLATVGLYGIMAHSVQRRAREMGIRLALGAQRSNVLGLVVREGMGLAGFAVVIGLFLAATAARLIEGFLFNVSPLDGATFAGMSLLFLLVAFVASYLPARRAAISDPLSAIRAD